MTNTNGFDPDGTLKRVYVGLVREFAERLPHTSNVSTVASGIMAGVVLHKADPDLMERIGKATSDRATWESIRESVDSWVEALRAARDVDAAVAQGAKATPRSRRRSAR